MIKFLQFLVNGSMNTAFGYGVFASLCLIGLPYFFAAPISFMIGTVFNYLTNKHFVFRSVAARHSLIKFLFVYGLLMILNLSLISVFVYVGVSEFIAGALALPPHVLLSFVMLRLFIFPRSP